MSGLLQQIYLVAKLPSEILILINKFLPPFSGISQQN